MSINCYGLTYFSQLKKPIKIHYSVSLLSIQMIGVLYFTIKRDVAFKSISYTPVNNNNNSDNSIEI